MLCCGSPFRADFRVTESQQGVNGGNRELWACTGHKGSFIERLNLSQSIKAVPTWRAHYYGNIIDVVRRPAYHARKHSRVYGR